jgi:membrane-bound ClpP family serine protease
MTDSYSNTPTIADRVADRVRRNAVNALLPAILITLIGWLLFNPLESPSGVKETTIAGTIWILRFAGPLLLVTAGLGRVTGRLWCFLLDTILSSCVALALALTVVVIFDELVKANLTVLIFAVFAAVYVRAAWSLWSEYFVLHRTVATAGPAPAAEQRSEQRRPSSTEEIEYPPAASADPRTSPAPPAPDEPAPDGFLANFADRKPGEDEKR